jgi:hypothetical protein
MIIVDEAAFVADQIFEDVLRPMTFATEGDILLASTPYGTSGFFYDAYVSDDWHTTHAETADNPLVSQEDLDEFRDGKTEFQIKREVLGEFVADTDRFFAVDDIRNCLGEASREADDVYLGADIAAAGSAETVLTLVDGKGNVFDIKTYRELGVLDAAEKIRLLDAQYGFEEILVDRGGLGQGTVEALTERANLGRRVREVYFTIQTKQELYQSLKASIEAQELTLPNDEKVLRDQLEGISFTETANNNLSLSASEGNDDYVDSLALAVEGIPETVGKATVKGAKGATKPVTMGDMRENDAFADRPEQKARRKMDQKRNRSTRVGSGRNGRPSRRRRRR